MAPPRCIHALGGILDPGVNFKHWKTEKVGELSDTYLGSQAQVLLFAYIKPSLETCLPRKCIEPTENAMPRMPRGW